MGAMNERIKGLRDGLKEQLSFLRRRLLARRRSPSQEVDELIQEAFLRLCRYQQEQKAPVRDPVAFLVEVAENLHIDHVRRSVVTGQIFSDQPAEEFGSLISSGTTPEQDAEAQELIERIERRFAEAHPHTRQAFWLHRFDGLTYQEIAQRLHISTMTVRRHIAKAVLLYDEELQAK